MKLSDIHAHTVATTVPIIGEDVDIVVRPALFTPEFEAKLAAATNAVELAELLAQILVSIDITEPDEHGNERPIQVDPATINRVIPWGVMGELWRAIGKAMRPGEAKGETSASG